MSLWRLGRKRYHLMHGSLATRLRVLRAERGLTVRQVAEHSGVAKETVSQIERGERHPYDRTLAKLAQAYDVPVEELLEEPVLAGAPGKAEASETGPSAGSTEVRITFDDEAVRAAIRAAKAGKLTKKEAARAIADAVRGGPADVLEDTVELLLEHAEQERSEDREGAKT
jgi:transcriptional regulator with XRE-family HTH domain